MDAKDHSHKLTVHVRRRTVCECCIEEEDGNWPNTHDSGQCKVIEEEDGEKKHLEKRRELRRKFQKELEVGGAIRQNLMETSGLRLNVRY